VPVVAETNEDEALAMAASKLEGVTSGEDTRLLTFCTRGASSGRSEGIKDL
jgi:hypothetical protein